MPASIVRTNSSRVAQRSAAIVVVARPSSPQTPGHFGFLTVCGSTSLVGSKCGDNSSKDQSRANGRKHCQIRFTHFNPLLTSLLQQSRYGYNRYAQSEYITPSGSVLEGKTMEASCTVGSFPCQLSQISLTDIPVWDEVWEQTTFRHLCLLW